MIWLEFFIAALATWRIVVLVSHDDGPFNICRQLRIKSKLLQCPRCTSVWAGAFVTFLVWLSGRELELAMYPMVALALSAAAIALDRTFIG